MIDSIDSPYIHAANTDTFTRLVLDNSKKGPVLVNFWSRKAGPCLRQYPILDKLIHQYEGRILLVNIDTEEEFIYTKQYGVNSVPTIKLFRHGDVVETLHGYQSENDLLPVIEKYAVKDSDLVLADVVKLYSEGKAKQAYEKLTEAIVSDPDNPRLPLALCKFLKYEERYNDALKLIASLPQNIRNHPDIDRFQDILSFHAELDSRYDMQAITAQLEENPEDVYAAQQRIAHLVVAQEYEQALQHLVALTSSQGSNTGEYAQQSVLRIFNILGNVHELVSKYRSCLRRYTH